jgi:hypothetical protein
MSKSLRKILGKREKTARRGNYHLVRSPTDPPDLSAKSSLEHPSRVYSGLYTVGLSARGREGTGRHSLASAYSLGERGEGGYRQ